MIEAVQTLVVMQCIVPCGMCDQQLTFACSSKREAARTAKDEHDWVVRDGQWVCPAHTLDCPHCSQPMSAAVAAAALRRIRQKQAAR